MEDKQELNDILISESEGKMANSKKILLLGGAGTLLFMIAIFIVYSLNKSDEQPETAAALPPKAMQQNTLSPTKADEPLFEQVPIKEEPSAEQKFESIVQEIKSKQVEPKQPEPVAPVAKTTTTPPAPAIPKAPQTSVQEKPKAPVVAKPEAPKAPVNQTAIPKGTYIQVGAFFKFTPDQKFMNTIKENNYTYYVHEVTSNGKKVNKVLIGPFKDRAEALKAIETIRAKIAKGAFITKV